MKGSKVRLATLGVCLVSMLQSRDVGGPILPEKFRKYCVTRQPPTSRNAEDIVCRCSCRSPVSVDKWVDVIQPPKSICGEHNRICRLPSAIQVIYEIIHERDDLEKGWRLVIANGYLARSILSSVRVQTHDCMEIERFENLLETKKAAPFLLRRPQWTEGNRSADFRSRSLAFDKRDALQFSSVRTESLRRSCGPRSWRVLQ